MKPRLKKFNKKNVNLSALVAAVRALADEFPNRVYRSQGFCMYRRSKQDDGTMSGCIIGEGLRRTGVSTSGLDRMGEMGESSIDRWFAKHGIVGNEAAWLNEVQQAQDSNFSWQKARKIADEKILPSNH